jgi:hypothetical protein
MVSCFVLTYEIYFFDRKIINIMSYTKKHKRDHRMYDWIYLKD